MASMSNDATEPTYPAIDGYRILSLLGEGRHGTVYRAVKTDTFVEAGHAVNEFAVKIYVSGDQGENGYASDDMKHRYTTEVKFLRLLQGHGNVVAMHESLDHANAIVMSLHSCDLHSLVHARRGLSEDVATHIMRGLLRGVQHVHERGVLHRDIKPENIAVHGLDNNATLIDFDCSCLLSDLEAIKGIRGTPGYIAPEVIVGVPYGTKADVFSIGGVMYYLFARTNPFFTRPFLDKAVYRKTLLSPITFGPRFDNVGFACKQLILLLLARKLTQRPSVQGALQHYWFVADSDKASPPSRFPHEEPCSDVATSDVLSPMKAQANVTCTGRERSVANDARLQAGPTSDPRSSTCTKTQNASPADSDDADEANTRVVRTAVPLLPSPPEKPRQVTSRPCSFLQRADSHMASATGTVQRQAESLPSEALASQSSIPEKHSEKED
eukprot:TRINITY_DN18219_c0_g1_i1.p1 TRINITY_DN18219_c0_g1~~TRINITY_DN18219_c0_g1_i1.p1  ORF type:complete len:440 (-),score=54.21 TRINITY_DN18219_c0_g1_i1:257-1576(-)